MNRVIILLGQRVRTGTNFVGSILAQHPDVVTVPPGRSFGEFNLFNDNIIVSEVYEKVIAKSFASGFEEGDLSAFLKGYGECWLKLITSKFQIQSEKVVFVKSPNITHTELWKEAYPDATIALICRDGRDNVISSVKASNDKRSWHSLWISFKKRFNFYSGRSFVNHCREWNESAIEIKKLKSDPRYKLFKYESLLNSEAGITDLLEYFKLPVTPEILQKCLDAPVVGSSFGGDEKGNSKPNWKPDQAKDNYRFTNKWNRWGMLKRMVFKRIAGKSLIDLEYEQDGNW